MKVKPVLTPSMEVVQVTQVTPQEAAAQNIAIPIIRNKPTLVRVFVQQHYATSSPVMNLSGALTGMGGTSPLAGTPQLLNDNITAALFPNTPDRSQEKTSLNFLLPLRWIAGDLSLSVELQPPPDRPFIKDETVQPVPVNTETRGKITIGYFPFLVAQNATQPSAAIANAKTLMTHLYPESTKPAGIDYVEVPIRPDPYPSSGQSIDLADVAFRVELLYYRYLNSHPSVLPDQVIGWLPYVPTKDDKAGISRPPWVTNSTKAFGVAVAAIDQGVKSPLMENRLVAHEVAHNFGLRHTNTKDTATSNGACLVDSHDDKTYWTKTYSDGRIQDPGWDLLAAPGSIFQDPALKYDFMTYCLNINTFISPLNYGLLSDLIYISKSSSSGNARSASVTPRANNPSDGFALVSGVIPADGSSPQLSPAMQMAASTSPDISDPGGTYCIRQSGGPPSDDFCFTPNFTDENDNATSSARFSYTIPFVSGTKTISLRANGQNLASFNSAGPPSISINSPQLNDTVGSSQTLAWTSSDPGGATLNYFVDYSPDGGSTWIPLSDALTASQYVIDSGRLLGPQVTFRVTATNGVDSSSATVGPLLLKTSPKLSVSSQSVNFGAVAVGQPASQTVTLTNTGSGLLAVSSIASNSPDVEAGGATVMYLGPGEARDVLIVNTPSATGPQSATITINGDTKISVTAQATNQTLPSLVLESPLLDFGSVRVGSSTTASIGIANLGSAPLDVTGLSVTSGWMVVSPQTPFFLQPGGSTTVTLSFTPTVSGSATGTLTVTTNDPSSGTATVTLTGSGVSVGAGGPQVSPNGVVNAADYVAKVSRGSLAFAFGANLASQAGQAQSLPLQQSINGSSVTVAGIAAPIYVVNPAFIEFQIPYEVPLGVSVPVVVSVNGSPSNSVSVTVADYAIGVFQYNRTASVVDPIIAHSNYSLVTPTSPAIPGESLLVIANGIGKLNNPPRTGAAVGLPYPTAADSPLITVAGITAVTQYAGLLPGALGVVQINVQLPQNLPSGSLPLVIQSTGDSSPSVNLYVQGNLASVPKLSLSTSFLAFDTVTVGQTKDLSLVASNAGNAPLTVNTLQASGSGFSVTSPAVPFTVQPQSSQTITVRYAPAAAGASSGSLTVSSNDPGSPGVVNFSGTGAAAATPAIGISPTSLNFGNVTVGQTKDLTVAINNSGGAQLTLNSLAASTGFLVTSPITPINIPPGGSTSVTVRFAPSTAAAITGTLIISSNDPKTSTLSIVLSGTGVAAGAQMKTVVLQVDNGVFNQVTGFGNTGQPGAAFINRLTPPSYPQLCRVSRSISAIAQTDFP